MVKMLSTCLQFLVWIFKQTSILYITEMQWNALLKIVNMIVTTENAQQIVYIDIYQSVHYT